MAVAEKKVQETSTSSPFDRVPVVSLVGVVYVLGCLGVVFKFVPELWRRLWDAIGRDANSFTANTLLVLAMLAAAVGLIVLGARLLGPKQQPGIRAGIFFGLLLFLFVLLMSRWVSLWVEYWVYYEHWFGDAGRTVGIAVTVLAAAGFLYLAGRWFLKPGFERMVLGFEGAGWFNARSYKPQQGQKVRRGTILGLLFLLGAGIYTMVAHNVLAGGSPDWQIGIPFTGTTVHISPGDARSMLDEKYPNWEKGVPSYEFRDKILPGFDPTKWVRIDSTREIKVAYREGDEEIKREFKPGEIVEKRTIIDLKKKLVESGSVDTDKDALPNAEEAKTKGGVAVVVPVSPPVGTMKLATITLLPQVQFTLPFLLLALSLWFAWRVVNLPSFADFLIATEAELNKVSWTTRKRLFQDTIVVLTTMVLLAALLFAMDQAWLHLLSWKRIGVIYQEDNPSQSTKGERPPW